MLDRSWCPRARGIVALSLLLLLVPVHTGCAAPEPEALDAPAAEELDVTTAPECCLHPELNQCGECVGNSYCDGCICWAPSAPLSVLNCPLQVPECPPPRFVKGICPQVVVWAKDPTSGLCCEYGTPCSAPPDWPQFNSLEHCLE